MKGRAMVRRKSRTPEMGRRLENVRQGILDHSGDDVPFFELEDWEIRGDPPPKPPTARRSEGRRRKQVPAP